MVELKVGDNTFVSVDVDPSDKMRKKGEQEKIIAKFDDLLDILKAVGQEVETSMKTVSETLTEFELSIAFEINAEGNFLISKVGAKSQIQGKFTWSMGN